jgi:hypothetical protein
MALVVGFLEPFLHPLDLAQFHVLNYMETMIYFLCLLLVTVVLRLAMEIEESH